VVKGTDVHKACIVGRIIGNPCKDSSAPAGLVLVKVMILISLTIAHISKGWENWDYFYYGFIPVMVLILTAHHCISLRTIWKVRDAFQVHSSANSTLYIILSCVFHVERTE